ncbi:cache domain-containing sensor histidine kinase [Paenibacillus harenae]|uniref:cache domain-containing sensor histidine kinase n=1 Tax=Paenibacillus harenae TaxID=306543 RepID=UPI002791CC68|nr:sensor histidine kinase [Paenibacillus harenae]MDQ0058676.1 two-component system sensor histidine kinase YesM [Paenibacillus harenae]
MVRRLRRLPCFRSVRAKLSIASIVCILVPAVLTMLIYNSLTKEAVEQQATTNATDAMKQVNGSVENLLQGMLNLLNYIQVNSDMQAFFKQVVSGRQADQYDQFMAMNRIIQQLEALTYIGEKSYISIILTNGATFTNYPKDEFDPKAFLDEPWFNHLKDLAGLESYWVESSPTVFYERYESPYQISVARTLRLDSSKIYGYAIVTMMENKVSRIFDGLKGGQDVMIVDGEGRIISSPHRERINEPFSYSRQVLENVPRTSSEIVKDGDRKILLTTSSLAFNDWHLVTTQPYQEAIVNISSIFNRVFLFQVVSFCVFLLLLLMLMRTFTKPLIHLGKVASSVQRGNLEVRSGVRGGDEIGRLGFLFDQMLDRIKEMLAEVSRTQARKRKAELAMLQAQINPHFLFNVLNSIRMKVMRSGDQDSAKMIASLSKLLRMTISREEDAITLHEEIELLTHYVELMNLRQKEEVKLLVDVDASAFQIKVPRFILQPLVENALIHGLSQNAGWIRVATDRKSDPRFLVLAVEDNGSGMDAEAAGKLMSRLSDSLYDTASGQERNAGLSGIGVTNVAERMRIMFGDRFRMTVSSEPGEGTKVRMHIAIREEERPHV